METKEIYYYYYYYYAPREMQQEENLNEQRGILQMQLLKTFSVHPSVIACCIIRVML